MLSRLVRAGALDLDAARPAGALFSAHLDAGLYVRTHLQAGHFQWAREAIARFELPLKSPDALRLAAAWREGLRSFTADRQLERNTDALGGFELIAP